MRKGQFLVLILIVLGVVLALPFNVSALTARQCREEYTGKGQTCYDDENDALIWFQTNEWGANRAGNWTHGILYVGGQQGYCLKAGAEFKSNKKYTKYNSIDFFISRFGLTEKQAQALITRLALYDYYLKHRDDATPDRVYFYGQYLIWNELLGWHLKSDSSRRDAYRRVGDEKSSGDYTTFNAGYGDFHYVWVDADIDKPQNRKLFPDSVKSDGSGYEIDLTIDAMKFAQENMNKYKGIAKVWWNGKDDYQPIIEFSGEYLKRIDYDYTIDSACTNCDNSNKNGAYIMQDTNNWEAIFNSEKSDNNNVKTYYLKSNKNDCKVYCREEYTVTFPNQSDKITLEAGKYFVVNKLGTTVYKETGSVVPNFKPIKVHKLRQCKATGSNTWQCLDKFGKNNGAGDNGTVKIRYQETKGSNYDAYDSNEITMKVDKARTIKGYNISGDMMSATATNYYRLPSDTYRYINKKDGKALLTTNGVVISNDKYENLRTANFPISFKNYYTSNNKPRATIILNYSLPTDKDDPNTKMYKAFNKNNDYLGTKIENLYSKESKGESLDWNQELQLKNSACAKMYGYGSEGYKSCRNARTANSMGNCYSSMVENSYQCEINACPEGERLCSDNVCSTDNGTKCPINKCKIVDDKYYNKSGKVVSDLEYAKSCGCRIVGNKYYDNEGKEVSAEEYYKACPPDTEKCKIVDNKYYYYNRDLITKEEYDKICPSGKECPPEIAKECPEDTWINGDPCLRCPSGACPMPGGVCPGIGNKIIYRTIDLNNPFPGQAADGRNVGSNWCDSKNCSNKNSIVKTQIMENRKVKTEAIYSKKPLYTFILDSNAIAKIQNYNKSHDYDDFELKCNNGHCYSNGFFRNGIIDMDTNNSQCSDVTKIATCAEE